MPFTRRLARTCSLHPWRTDGAWAGLLVPRLGAASQRDLRPGELVGIPAALVVLLLVFGAVVAALLPLLLAGVGLVVALGVLALVGQAWQLSIFVVNMVFGIGLALGIDYVLFI